MVHWRRAFSLGKEIASKDSASELCFAFPRFGASWSSTAQMVSRSQPLGQIDALFVLAVNGPDFGWSDRAVGSTEAAWDETKAIVGASVSRGEFWLFIREQ